MPRQYLRELRERAVRLVAEHRGEDETEYAGIRSIAAKLGIVTPESLRKGRWGSTSRSCPLPGSGGNSGNSVEGQLAAGPRAPCGGHRGGRTARLRLRYPVTCQSSRRHGTRAAAGMQFARVFAVPGPASGPG
jgi:hypothetical protein